MKPLLYCKNALNKTTKPDKFIALNENVLNTIKTIDFLTKFK